MVLYSIKSKKNICGRTSLYFDETMFRNIKPGLKRQYIQNIPEYNKKLVNFWSEVEKFISRLSVRISHHPNWNGSIKDEILLVPFRRVLYEICKRQLIVYKPIELNRQYLKKSWLKII